MIPDSILGHPGLSPTAKLIFAFLARCAGKNGSCFPSFQAIATALHISRRQAIRGVQDLAAQGLLATVKRRGASGNTSNSYIFIWQECLTTPSDRNVTRVVSEMSPRREPVEEKNPENTVFEPLPTAAPRPQAADAARCALRSIIHQRSGHTISEGQIDAMIVRATVRTGKPVSASKCAAVAMVLPLPSGRSQAIQSAAWWVSAVANAFEETREGAENYRPEDFLPSPAAEEPDGRWAELMDEVCPVN